VSREQRDSTMRIPALEIAQRDRSVFVFGVDGRRLEDFAAVSRVRRDESARLEGYQRPEVVAHIRAIRRYLESDGAILPNAIVLAFDSSVVFEPHGAKASGGAVTGDLVIPVPSGDGDLDKPAWLVDGQQRSAALRDADLEGFHVPAVGFIARDTADQRAQFILVNSTKPLPPGLIHELLPQTGGELPPKYARKRLPATVMTLLNHEDDSPFKGLIATPTEPWGYIKDNSVLKMIENSLYDGALYQYRDPMDGSGDEEQMALHLKVFWNVVRATWPDAWSQPPRRSRLTHGVGIQSLGYVMDALTEGVLAADIPGTGIEERLAGLVPHCAWTSGHWQFNGEEPRRWNALQNTPQDVRLLSAALRRWSVSPK